MATVNVMYALLIAIARTYHSTSPLTNGSHESIKEICVLLERTKRALCRKEPMNQTCIRHIKMYIDS